MNVPDGLEAERALLGAVMMRPGLLDEVRHLGAGDFHLPMHEELWQMVLDQDGRGKPFDPATLGTLIPATGTGTGLDAVVLSRLCEHGHLTPMHAVAYAEQVCRRAVMRRSDAVRVKLGQALQETAPDDFGGVLEAITDELQGIADGSVTEVDPSVSDMLGAAVPQWFGEVDREYTPTGWADIDRHFNGGWVPGQLTVIGARPGVGKSLMATCATLAAMDYGVAFFSLEMRSDELLARMAANLTGIPLGDILGGKVRDQGDREKLNAVVQDSRSWPFRLKSQPSLSMAYMRATMRAWMREQELRLVIIDYAQIVKPADSKESRERQVSRIAEDAKDLARALNVHVILLAQVNRGSALAEVKRPTMAHLRESGGIEAAADNIILLHPSEHDDGTTVLECIVEKSRHGARGTEELVYRPDVGAIQGMNLDAANYPHGSPGRVQKWREASRRDRAAREARGL